MVFLLNKTVVSALRLHSQKADDPLLLSKRGFHVEPGAREKALLAEDASLKRFKSPKKSVRRLKIVGDVLTIVVVAGCCYEIYVKAVMREQARKAMNTSQSHKPLSCSNKPATRKQVCDGRRCSTCIYECRC